MTNEVRKCCKNCLHCTFDYYESESDYVEGDCELGHRGWFNYDDDDD